MEEKSEDAEEKQLDLDDVLVNELGQFGCFQIRNILLVAFPIIIGVALQEYIFSAAAIPHRCRIPECGEQENLHNFEPDWISNAIPRTTTGFASCRRYAPHDHIVNGSLEYCPITMFNQSLTTDCDAYVYARDNSVVYEFDLGCQDWLRALAGTMNSVGALFSLPLTGFISDRFGRRFALIFNVLNAGVFGLMRAFSVNYTMYLVLQILQSIFGGGIFSSGYIFCTELVGPKYRVLASFAATSMFTIGQVLLGSVAWLIQPWRYFIMSIHIPCFLIVFYYWILSESVRWLLSKKKYEEARKVLYKVAKVNNTTISKSSIEALVNSKSRNDSQKKKPNVIKYIVKSPILLRRVCTTPIWWVTTTFVFYGMSLNSTTLSDTMYLNYILTCAVEIPGYLLAMLVLDRIGRRATLSTGVFMSAACNIAFIFISTDLKILRLGVYLLGKVMISVVVNSVYLYTSELYPTEFRHSLLAFSSMIGRIGSISAPLTPVLANYWHGIPSMLFGTMGIISGLLVLTQPDTLGTKMPDTIAEAEALGRSKK